MCALRTSLWEVLHPFIVQSTIEDDVSLEAIRVMVAIIAVDPVRDNPADPSLRGHGLCPKGSFVMRLLD